MRLGGRIGLFLVTCLMGAGAVLLPLRAEGGVFIREDGRPYAKAMEPAFNTMSANGPNDLPYSFGSAAPERLPLAFPARLPEVSAPTLARFAIEPGLVVWVAWGEGHPTRVVGLFTGLAQKPNGTLMLALANEVIAQGAVAVILERDDGRRPYIIDIEGEARRMQRAKARIEASWGMTMPGGMGESLGGGEGLIFALLESDVRVAVRDPVLDLDASAAFMERAPFFRFAVVGVREFFQRVATGRYGEPPGTSLASLVARSADRGPRSPAARVCGAPNAWPRLSVTVSSFDPALGPTGAATLRRCGAGISVSPVPGHVPLAVEPEAVRQMVGWALSM